MCRCYSCHMNNALYKCTKCGIKICDMCSTIDGYDILCTGCFADNYIVQEIIK